ncbi:MAG TPA: hypothetical protein PKL77_05730 [Candidatus Omnitrophota bacterium]|nr:hypothetical protein [Candidatus Omnitrophota bacterium]HPT06901.1 hypothetical protein [Candidatus Omnitrophota bacterium]
MGKKTFLFPFFLALCPIILLFYMVVSFRIEVPFRDSWVLVPFMEKFFQGTLTLGDLFLQHCEHRTFFPRIIILSLARLTGWNLFYESLLNVVCAIGIFLMFLWLLRKTSLHIGLKKLNYWLIPLCSVFIFSLSQHENFWVGFQITFMLSVLAVVAGIVVLSAEKLTFVRVGTGCICGIIAAFSNGIGLVFWVVGFFIIVMMPCLKEKGRGVFLASWAVISGIVFTLYFLGFQRPVYPEYSVTKELAIFSSPFEYGKFFLEYLGTGVSYFSSKIAYCFSLLGLGIFIVCGRFLMIQSRRDAKLFIPYVSLCLFAVGAALVTGLNRAGWYSMTAFFSHYTTVSLLFWVSICGMLYFTSIMDRRKSILVFSRIVISVLICTVLLGSMVGFFEWKSNNVLLQPVRYDLQRSAPSDSYIVAVNGLWGSRHDIEFLRAYHLTIFRNQK